MYKVIIETSNPAWKQFDNKVFRTRQEAVNYLWQLGFVPAGTSTMKTKDELKFALYKKPVAQEGEYIIDFDAPEMYAYVFRGE